MGDSYGKIFNIRNSQNRTLPQTLLDHTDLCSHLAHPKRFIHSVPRRTNVKTDYFILFHTLV